MIRGLLGQRDRGNLRLLSSITRPLVAALNRLALYSARSAAADASNIARDEALVFSPRSAHNQRMAASGG
jgi:hypothetical protein